MYKERKKIVVESCHTCPFYFKCKPWNDLEHSVKFRLTYGDSPRYFILKGCPLPDGEDGEEATNIYEEQLGME